jgi:probable F420-dependent oxidoreductase
MKLGTTYPQIELGGDPHALRRFAEATEQLGYDHILLYDHVVGAVHEGRDPPLWGPYTEKDPFHDIFTAFAYLAALTERIELISGILILPQRQTVLVAKQAADVDLMSNGRLRLGVGSGWNYVEYDALGEEWAKRGAKMSEQIPYLRRLWSEEAIDWRGQFDQIDRGNIVPRPKRQIPIYCGGFADPAFRRAAKLADGFIFASALSDQAIASWGRVKELLREEGRSTEDFGTLFVLHPDQPNVRINQIAEALLRLRDAGADEASIVTMQKGFATVDQHIDFITEVKAKAEAALR